MPKTSAFENDGPAAYDAWFEANHTLYQTEIEAVRNLMPIGKGLEIGAGTGRFAAPLGIEIGVEPSLAMAAQARKRGISILQGVAESLPITDQAFDFAIMITVVCFLEDPMQAFLEANRVLRRPGMLIVGFIDKDSELGRRYSQRKERSRFYKEATFHSVAHLKSLLFEAGFADLSFRQALFPDGIDVRKVEVGHGRGSFVVVRAAKV